MQKYTSCIDAIGKSEQMKPNLPFEMCFVWTPLWQKNLKLVDEYLEPDFAGYPVFAGCSPTLSTIKTTEVPGYPEKAENHSNACFRTL